jgi:hypothetical protein
MNETNQTTVDEPRHGSGPTGPTFVAGPTPDPVYDFERLGVKIAENLVLMAEAQVAEATALLEQTKALAESIRSQVQIQSDALSNLNGRLKTFGGELLEAHRKFNGGHKPA